MLKVEKMQLKEALIISYGNDTTRGKISLKKDYEDFEEKKHLVLSKLIQDGLEVIECKDILYYSDENLQEYLK
jgi:hypothetical protein